MDQGMDCGLFLTHNELPLSERLTSLTSQNKLARITAEGYYVISLSLSLSIHPSMFSVFSLLVNFGRHKSVFYLYTNMATL